MVQSKIHTTVNLSKTHAELLRTRAEQLAMKHSQLSALLLRKLLKNWKTLKRTLMSVEYQRNSAGESWKKLHVFFETVDYEVFTDMRNCFKWSVSALLAMAIRRYLEDSVQDNKDNFKWDCDNYQILGYQCDGKMHKNNICWHIIWELDEKFAKKLHK